MDLPIDVVPDPASLKFRWRHTVNTLVGPRTEEYVGTIGITVERAVADLVALAKRTEEERAKLQAFKDWVHAYLDGKGVPVAPPGTHGAEGCRIGDRMDWVFKALSGSSAEDALKAEIAALKQQNQGHIDRIAAQGELLSKRAEAVTTGSQPRGSNKR